MKRTILALVSVPSLLWGASFHVIGGSEADSSQQMFFYVGIIKDFDIKKDIKVAIRLFGDYLAYSFQVGSTKVKAEAPSFQGGIGIKWVSPVGVFSLIPGWEARNTTVKPDVPGVKIKGLYEGFAVTGDAYIPLPRNFLVTLVGSYSTSTSYLWGRLRVSKGIYFNNFRFGTEFIGQGNYDYRAFQFAPTVEFAKSNYSILLRAGYKDSSAGKSIYGGIDFYVGF